MRSLLLSVVAILPAALAPCSAGSQTPSQAPKEVPISAAAEEVRQAKEITEMLGLQPSFTVRGDIVLDTPFLGAKEISFEPNSRLIFSKAAINKRRNLIVMASKLVQKDPTKPGTITWARGDGPSDPPPIAGQASTGSPGGGQGHPGTLGAGGVQGNKGLEGADAPNLTMFFLKFEGAPPMLEFSGQKGGKGGIGQQGGTGGPGREGRPAANGGFDCKRGPGDGGAGGPGGPGGKGGVGGVGGDGGAVTLISAPEAFPAALQLVRVVVQGGAGGNGGDGGPGGVGGPGGGGAGPIGPYCHGHGRNGDQGGGGAAGPTGDPGASGGQGDVFYAVLPREKLSGLGLGM